MKTIDLGLIDYQEAYIKQKEILDLRKNGRISDTLLVAEHFPVFTIGRAGSSDNLLVESDVLERKRIKLIETDRGGDITFHGPGQLVAYPVIDLKEWTPDLHKYIRSLEEVLIAFLAGYGLEGRRLEDASGVWAGDKKIGFVGIGVSGWISFHGISININTDLSFFSMIRSCGIKGVEITSLSKVLKRKIDINEAKSRLISNFKKVFTANGARNIPALA